MRRRAGAKPRDRAVPVVLDGSLAFPEPDPDLGVAQAIGDQQQDLFLATGQAQG